MILKKFLPCNNESEIIDQLGGWSLKNVEQGYVSGYSLEVLVNWLEKVKL